MSDGVVILWSLKPTCGAWHNVRNENDLVKRVLRGCDADIYDIAWSPQSDMFMTGSIDNSVIIWHAAQGRILHRLQEHTHYVQGCAWDPLNALLVSQSSDRTARIYSYCGEKPSKKPKLVQALRKRLLPPKAPAVPPASTSAAAGAAGAAAGSATAGAGGEGQAAPAKAAAPSPRPGTQGLFMDESLPSFFRRPSFSPDGNLVFFPAGQLRGAGEGESFAPTVFGYVRNSWSTPALHLPGPDKAVVVRK